VPIHMKRRAALIVYGIGLILYVTSFFLPAATTGLPGYWAAYVTGIAAMGITKDLLHGVHSTEPISVNLAILYSALVNPLFLLYAAAAPFKPRDPTVAFIRIVLPLLLPFSWVVFDYKDFHPSSGYWVWNLGILVVLSSGLRKPSAPAVSGPPAEGGRKRA
jgi:hypothetical protein